MSERNEVWIVWMSGLSSVQGLVLVDICWTREGAHAYIDRQADPDCYVAERFVPGDYHTDAEA